MFLRLKSAIILLVCFISVFIASGSTTATFPLLTNETDRQALLAIKALILDDPFQLLTSWNHSLHFCDWQGVRCGHKHQRVTLLDLSSYGLTGSLSPHIGNLTFLRNINLNNNTFHGAIPQEIGRLFRLQSLRLVNNSFEGELPANLTHCSNIEVINIVNSNLGGEFPAWLSSLSSLSLLQLSVNHFIGSIPASFGNLSALKVLSLVDNNLGGSIPFELGKLSQLQFLQLAVNHLTGMVPTQLFNISSLTYFNINTNELRGSLPPNLGLNFPNLQKFDVLGNQIYGPIPSSIANASQLKVIDLAQNSFTGSVPMNVGKLYDLEIFSVQKNSLGTNEGDELNNIVISLSNCSNLVYLGLGGNRFQGSLPHSIGNLSRNLNYLYMNHNNISSSIPLGIGNLINLLILALNENMLTERMPDSIGKLSKLGQFYMYENSISGKIPSSIGNLTQLSTLAMASNMLEESIPISLGNCTSLSGLDLGYNHLTGRIPKQIFGLSTLSRGLFMDHNHLAGPIPMEVGNLKNLGQLDLSGNKLSGGIPATLGSCQVLELLYLDENLLEGTIPESFYQLKGIQDLDLSRNKLFGKIPKFFGDLIFLQNLNLSYNMFEGEVPSERLFRNISAFSVAGNNKLCGGVKELKLPACPAKVMEKKKRHLNYKVMVPLITTSFILVILFCLAANAYRSRRSKQPTSTTSPLQDKYPKLSYAEILQATNGFSSSNLIGEGKYGSVFKGILNTTGQIIAVKVLKLQERAGSKSFSKECEALKNIRHRNLVKIITSCSSTDHKRNDFKALVFEFMENGSLDDWLYPRSLHDQQHAKISLNLLQRLNIAIDVAAALDYLHYHCEVTVIHCDLKPSNVLLDADFCAHVSDFGLAKILLPTTGTFNNQQQSSSIGIGGTIGYVAPEYGMGEEASTQGDMYSYGVLLLEMFIGKRPTDNMFVDSISLPSYAKMSLPDHGMEIIDPRMISEEEMESNRMMRNNATNLAKLEFCIASALQIGVSCSVAMPSERMDARDVLVELHKIRNVFLGVREQGSQYERRNKS